MKAILEFNLPEDNEDYKLISQGIKTSLALQEMDNHLRKEIKYNYDAYTDEQMKVLEDIRKTLWVIIEEYEISL